MSHRALQVIFLLITISIAAFIVSVSCNGTTEPFGTPLYIHSNDPYTQNDRFVTSLTVTPYGVNLTIGGLQQFRATAVFNDGLEEEVTDKVEWYTETPAVGAFEAATGRFLSKKPGVAVVRCRLHAVNGILQSSASYANCFFQNGDIPPAVPLNPKLDINADGVFVDWDLNQTDYDVIGYNIWRTQTSSAHYSTEGTGAAHYSPADFGRVNGAPVLYPPYLDRTVISGWYYYRVTAEDLLGLHSAPSKEVSIFVTGISHYSSYDSAPSTAEQNNYKDAFSTAF
jgi:hypothetical protein